MASSLSSMTAVIIERIAPVLTVHDLDAAVVPYRRLGFATDLDEHAQYGFVERGADSFTLFRRTRTTLAEHGRGVPLCFRRQCASRGGGFRRSRRPVHGAAQHTVWPSGVRLHRPRWHRASSRFVHFDSRGVGLRGPTS
jgi:hypothetical protein